MTKSSPAPWYGIGRPAVILLLLKIEGPSMSVLFCRISANVARAFARSFFGYTIVADLVGLFHVKTTEVL